MKLDFCLSFLTQALCDKSVVSMAVVRQPKRSSHKDNTFTGKPVKVIEKPRRPGDPPALYADSAKAQRELGWTVKFTDIESIVATAWQWHSSHPRGYGDR